VTIRQPKLVPHARYRWDALRGQHQLLFPEGLLVLNETGAAIVKLCDGRPVGELVAALQAQFEGRAAAEEVEDFLARLAAKGLVRDAADS
jgi:pyrroloquinoline quinone biosynthesis protein D